MILNEHFEEFISLLNQHKVKYVLVGGWAVIFEGYGRLTSDIDFLVQREDENAEKILDVLKQFFGSTIGFSKDDFLKHNNVLMMGRPPFRIDILTSITGVEFEEVYSNSKIYKGVDFEVRCINIQELIKNKKATGRLKDAADAHTLEKILKKRNTQK